jgi:enoyl-CoA hydratase
VLTGEPIDAQRAFEWGLIEDVADDVDHAVSQVVDSLLASDPAALRAQKELLHLWEEAPLAAGIAASVERFAGAYLNGTPKRMTKD